MGEVEMVAFRRSGNEIRTLRGQGHVHDVCMTEVPPLDYAAAIAAAWVAYRQGDVNAGLGHAWDAHLMRLYSGEPWYVLGIHHERAGRLGRADYCFRRATSMNEDPYPPPFRVSWRRFQVIVDDAIAGLPDQLSQALNEVTVVLADYIDPLAHTDEDEREVLGLFEGVPRAERLAGEEAGEISPRISIFRRAHEHVSLSFISFAQEVRGTLIHELGHYLGLDEDQLEQLGWA